MLVLRGGEPLAAAEQPRPFAPRLGDGLQVRPELSRVHRRAHLHTLLHAVSDPQLARALDQRFRQPGRDGGRGDGARCRGAPLAGAAEGALHDPFDRQIEVGVVEDDHRVLASHLQRDLHAASGDALVESKPDLVGSGEADGPDPRVVRDHVADGAARPGDHVQHARREPGLGEGFGDQVRADRRQRGRLENDGASGDQRRRRLPHRDGEGEVPRRDQRDRSDRLAQGEAESAPHLGGQRLAVLPETLSGIELEDVEPAQDLAPRLRQDLALFPAERLGDEIHLLLEDGIRPREDPAPLGSRRRRPPRERLRRGVDRGLRVRRAALGELSDRLTRVGGIHTRVVLVGGWRHPRAADPVPSPLFTCRDAHGAPSTPAGKRTQCPPEASFRPAAEAEDFPSTRRQKRAKVRVADPVREC